MSSYFYVLLAFLIVELSAVSWADEAADIRVGVLKFGTVNWELDVIRDQSLDQQQGVKLEVVPLATKNASTVALQGGAVDVIVSDWLWVSRQRAQGRAYTFVPYSKAVGAVMVRPDAGIVDLAALRGKRLGVAGGPVDKSWLLLRAYSKKTLGADLSEWVEPNFAAPPLLNQLALRGELPAVLNFWHYTARLKAAGLQQLVAISEVLSALGVEEEVPLIGWVFDEGWAEQHPEAVRGFLRASQEAKGLLAASDALWETLRPAMKAEDQATFIALRDGYRAGIPRRFGEQEIAAASKVYEILAREGGERLVGKQSSLSPGTFWIGYSF